MDGLYPVFLSIKDQKCLVIGGGTVAERKVASLLECGAKVKVVAPEITPELKKRILAKDVEYEQRLYETEDLDGLTVGRSLIFVATNDPAVNQQVHREGINRGFLVNVVDDPPHCSFYVPSMIRRGALCVAISTAGKSPMLARKIREKLEGEFGPEYAEYLEVLGDCRQEVLRRIPEEKERRRIFEQLVDSDLLEMIRNKQTEQVKERVSQCLSSRSD